MRRAPRALPAAWYVGLLISLALIALAAVGVRELIVSRGWSSGSPWIPSAVDQLDGLTSDASTVAVSIAAVVLGAALVILALLPARRTHVPATAEAAVWVSPAALGELARATVSFLPGVEDARLTRASRRSVGIEADLAPGSAADRSRKRSDLTHTPRRTDDDPTPGGPETDREERLDSTARSSSAEETPAASTRPRTAAERGAGQDDQLAREVAEELTRSVGPDLTSLVVVRTRHPRPSAGTREGS